ncbi:MAG: cupin-like domain-containing protein [Myxococcota bacterium]
MLEGQGLDPDTAEAEVRAVTSSPVFAAARKVVHRSAAMEQAARLRRHFEGQHPLEVPAGAGLDDDAFHRLCWTAHRPIVLRGAASDWPVWSLEGLERRFGDVEIEVLAGRTRQPRWWTRREALRTRMPLRELLDVMAGPGGDDVYGVGRNDVLDALPELRSEIGTLPGLTPEASWARLWIGPAGTVTPLHHDQSAAWLVQRIGWKRVWLASPLEPALFDGLDGVFSPVDPSVPAQGELADVRWWEARLGPGDAVFLPAGWWHRVVSETASVSVSLGNFRWPNNVEWYAPGRFAPGRL